MHILVITFGLRDLELGQYRGLCAQIAAGFAQLPGLAAKIWLDSPETNQFGGVYIWESRAALEAYLASETFAQIGANPHFSGVTARSFGTIAEATAQTWDLGVGLAALAAPAI